MKKQNFKLYKIFRQINEDLWGTFEYIKYKEKNKNIRFKKKKEINYYFENNKKFKLKNFSKIEKLYKLRKYYINLSKKQFKKILNTMNNKGTIKQILEKRIDTIVYRLNYARSFLEARQLISHGHILLNGHYIVKPNHILQIGDKIELKKKKKKKIINNLFNSILNKKLHINCPNYLEVNYNINCAILIKQPINIPYATLM